MSYRITTNKEEMDISAIHQFLSQSYWAKDIPLDVMKKAVENSLCFAVLFNDQLVGFSRMVTDKATFAYLADVFILEDHRKQGLSKQLMKVIMEHPELQGLRRIVLATRDAHNLYKQFGFTSLNHPKIFMEVWNPSVYQN